MQSHMLGDHTFPTNNTQLTTVAHMPLTMLTGRANTNIFLQFINKGNSPESGSPP